MKIYLNNDIFLFFENGQICLWEYKSNGNFTLESRYLERIVEIASGSAESGHELDQELIDCKVATLDEPSPSQWQWGVPARIYHGATKNAFGKVDRNKYDSFFDQYIDLCYELYKDVAEPELRSVKEGKVIPLPAPQTGKLQATLWEALRQRKTTRHFLPSALEIDVLSTLLYATFGEIHGPFEDLEKRGLKILSTRKSSPAAGGVHAHDAYVIALNVTGLSPGVYFYQCDRHELIQISAEDCRPIITELVAQQDFIADIGALVAITTRFDRIWVKYKHSRAYRTALLDIGHLSQTFHLCAGALGTCSWLTAAFEDDALARVLGIMSDTEAPMFMLGVGNGTGDYLHPTFQEAIDRKLKRANWFSEDED